jgi:hypothetical protein
VKGYSFKLTPKGYVKYSSRKDGLNNNLLHRIIMDNPDDKQVDHINNNKLDNRKENLRVCTHQENSFNKKKNSNNTSGYKGVCWHKQKDKWAAQIQVNGKVKFLGCFATAKVAHDAYCLASAQYHGEFSNTG